MIKKLENAPKITKHFLGSSSFQTAPCKKTISHIKSPSEIEIAFSMELLPLKTQSEMSKSHFKMHKQKFNFWVSKKR